MFYTRNSLFQTCKKKENILCTQYIIYSINVQIFKLPFEVQRYFASMDKVCGIHLADISSNQLSSCSVTLCSSRLLGTKWLVCPIWCSVGISLGLRATFAYVPLHATSASNKNLSSRWNAVIYCFKLITINANRNIVLWLQVDFCHWFIQK